MKTKKTLSVISLLITCVISFALAFSVAPKDNAKASTITGLVFSDAFQGDISDGWAFARKDGVNYAVDGTKTGTWPTKNGNVVFGAKEYGKAFYGTADMTNYVFEVKVKADVNETVGEYLTKYSSNLASGLSINTHIPFFVNDVLSGTNNTFKGRSVCFNNYAIGFYQYGDTTGWATNGTARINTKLGDDFDWRAWHTIKVVALQSRCDLYLDGVLMVSALNDAFTKATGTAGYAGIVGIVGENYSTLYFDDFKVWGEKEISEPACEIDMNDFTDKNKAFVFSGNVAEALVSNDENKIIYNTDVTGAWYGTDVRLLKDYSYGDFETTIAFDIDNQKQYKGITSDDVVTSSDGTDVRVGDTGFIFRANASNGKASGYILNYLSQWTQGSNNPNKVVLTISHMEDNARKTTVAGNYVAIGTITGTTSCVVDLKVEGDTAIVTAYRTLADKEAGTVAVEKTVTLSSSTGKTYDEGNIGFWVNTGSASLKFVYEAQMLAFKSLGNASYRFVNGANLMNANTSIGYGVGASVLNYDGTKNTVGFKDAIGTKAILDSSYAVSDFTTIFKLDLDNQAEKKEIRTSADSGVLFRANLTDGNNDITGYYLQYYARKTDTSGAEVNTVELAIRKQSGKWQGDSAFTGSGINITDTTTVWVRLTCLGSTITYTAYTSEADCYNDANGKTATVTDSSYTEGYIGLKCNDGTNAKFDYEATFLPETRETETTVPVADSFSMINGASIRIRTDGTSGLRFGLRIDKADYDKLSPYSPVYGAVVIPTDLKGAVLNLNTAKVRDIPAPSELSLIDDVYYYNVALLSIPEAEYGRMISARGYVKITVEGKEYVYYTDYTDANNSRSIKEVATRLINSGDLNKYTAEQREIVKKYAGVTYAESNVQALGNAGGYPRIISLDNGNVFMTYSSKSAISADDGETFANPLTVTTATADPVNSEYKLIKGNLTPVKLKNGNVAVFYRAIPDGLSGYSAIRYKIYNVTTKEYGEEKTLLENYNSKKDSTGLWEPSPYFAKNGDLYVYVSNDLSGSDSYGDINANSDLVCTGGYQNLIVVKCSVSGDEITVNGRQTVMNGVSRKSRDGMNVLTELSDGSYAMVFEGTVNGNYRVFVSYSNDMLSFTTPQTLYYNQNYSSGAPYIVTLPDGRIAISYFTDEDYKGDAVTGFKGKVMRLYVSDSVVKYGDALSESNFTRKEFRTFAETEYYSYGSMAVIGDRFFITGCNGSNDGTISIKPLTLYVNAYLV